MAIASPVISDESATPARPVATWRSLLCALTVARLRVWTRNRFLGYWWWLLEPLCMTAIYVAVVQVAFGAQRQYVALFVMCAVLPWSWFTAATSDALMSLQRNRGRILSFRVDATLFPTSDVLATLIRYLSSLGVFAALLVYYQIPPTRALAWLPLVVVVQSGWVLGCSLWLSIAQVYAEDTSNAWRLVTRVWFFLGPSIYSLSQIPAAVASWLWINPFTALFHGYREILIHGRTPAVASLVVSGLVALAMAMLGYYYLRRLQPHTALAL